MDWDSCEIVKIGMRASFDTELDPMLILSDDMMAAMHEVGVCFEAGEYYVPEMLAVGTKRVNLSSLTE